MSPVTSSSLLVLACPSWPAARLPADLASAAVELSARPGRDELDTLIAERAPGRLVVAGDDADLGAVMIRLLRTERLEQVAVAYLPATPSSLVAKTWGLPTGRSAAAEQALHGPVEAVPLVRDDAGGVLLGRGELRRIQGVAYCDNERVLRGSARRLVVTPAAIGVRVRVVPIGPLPRRGREATGRAVQIACRSGSVILDGVAHPRPVTRWTWYRHTSDWRLVRGRHQ